ncbi:zinc-binding domain-containing protein [Aspergillus alliaceus]|uniref:Zinc-binding domain-containing protein n=1 Tax=Petromyces alliaceus TaxID=209559 RepID=A0A5N7CKW9_PETAA|nr:zinc-binding domain-containing protein [Aspergillus alliaceus]
MPNKRPKRDHRWSMYSSLHDSVSRLLEKDNLYFEFHGTDNTTNCTKEYDTNIMGRFMCRNHACDSSGWSSKKIAITIRMYPGAKYNARVYHQRCKSCNSLSRPSLDDSYAERVVYRLKKWSGIQMSPLDYSGKKGPPHNSDLCEGCRAGHCIASGFKTYRNEPGNKRPFKNTARGG